MPRKSLAKYSFDGIDFVYPEGASKYPTVEEFLARLPAGCKKIVKECYSDPDGSVWCQLKDGWYSADDQSLLLVCNELEQEPLDEMCAAYLVSKDVYKLDDEGFKNWLH